jgi:hypothetical protein
VSIRKAVFNSVKHQLTASQQIEARLRDALDSALSALREEKRFGTVAMIQARLIKDGGYLAADEFKQALAAK